MDESLKEFPLQFVLLGMALRDKEIAKLLTSEALTNPGAQALAAAFSRKDRAACTAALARWGIVMGPQESPAKAIVRWAKGKDEEARRRRLLAEVKAMSADELERLLERVPVDMPSSRVAGTGA
jgi:hypothetical protein